MYCSELGELFLEEVGLGQAAVEGEELTEALTVRAVQVGPAAEQEPALAAHEPPGRPAAAKRYKKVASATAVIWRTLLIAEQTFRKLDAPELLPEVAEGVRYADGIRVKPSKATADEKAAA